MVLMLAATEVSTFDAFKGGVCFRLVVIIFCFLQQNCILHKYLRKTRSFISNFFSHISHCGDTMHRYRYTKSGSPRKELGVDVAAYMRKQRVESKENGKTVV